jgi:hypothetical protein
VGCIAEKKQNSTAHSSPYPMPYRLPLPAGAGLEAGTAGRGGELPAEKSGCECPCACCLLVAAAAAAAAAGSVPAAEKCLLRVGSSAMRKEVS